MLVKCKTLLSFDINYILGCSMSHIYPSMLSLAVAMTPWPYPLNFEIRISRNETTKCVIYNGGCIALHTTRPTFAIKATYLLGIRHFHQNLISTNNQFRCIKTCTCLVWLMVVVLNTYTAPARLNRLTACLEAIPQIKHSVGIYQFSVC